MIINVWETDRREASELLTLAMIRHLTLSTEVTTAKVAKSKRVIWQPPRRVLPSGAAPDHPLPVSRAVPRAR